MPAQFSVLKLTLLACSRHINVHSVTGMHVDISKRLSVADWITVISSKPDNCISFGCETHL